MGKGSYSLYPFCVEVPRLVGESHFINSLSRASCAFRLWQVLGGKKYSVSDGS